MYTIGYTPCVRETRETYLPIQGIWRENMKATEDMQDKGLLQITKENNVQMKSRRIPQLLMSIRIPTLRTLMLCIFGYVGVVWLVYYRKSFFFDTENVEQIKLPMYKQKTMFPHFRNPSHLSQNSSCKRDMHCSCTFKGIFHIVCFSHHGQSKLLPLDLSQIGFPSKQQVQNSVRIKFPYIYISLLRTQTFFF